MLAAAVAHGGSLRGLVAAGLACVPADRSAGSAGPGADLGAAARCSPARAMAAAYSEVAVGRRFPRPVDQRHRQAAADAWPALAPLLGTPGADACRSYHR